MTLNTKSRTRSENMKWKILLIILLSLLCQNLFSQIYWQKTYSAFGDEEAYDICPADNNNYYLVGITAPFFRKAYVIKINEFGDTLWTRTYFDGEIYTAAPTSDGGCIFAGYSGQAFACRINSNGDTLWVKTYNTINFQDIKKTPDNDYILCGANYSNEHYNGYVCKIDSNGNLIWEKIYPSVYTLDMIRIELALDGGYLVGGSQRYNSAGPVLAFLCRINEIGIITWQKNYRFNTNDLISGIEKCNNGYVLTGRSNDKLALLKVGLTGDSILGFLQNNTNGIYYGPNITRITDNKYAVANINGPSESRIHILDSNLNIVRQLTIQNFEGITLRSSYKVTNSSSDDMIFVGIATIEPGNEEAYAIRIDSALTPPPPIGMPNNAIFVTTDYTLFQNYPNPFNPSTTIGFELERSANVIFEFYDIQGRTVEKSSKKIYSPGKHNFIFDGSKLSSGIYFYQLTIDGDIVDTKKMLLLK